MVIEMIIAAIGAGLANLSIIAWVAIYFCIFILYHYSGLIAILGGLIAILFGIVYVILKRFGIRPRRN